MRDGSGMRTESLNQELTKPAEGDWVRVTGIVSIEQPPDAGVSIPVIRVRRQSDILKCISRRLDSQHGPHRLRLGIEGGAAFIVLMFRHFNAETDSCVTRTGFHP